MSGMLSVIELHELSRSFDAFQLGPLSFSLPPGRIYGVLGPNGAGKTTLFNLLALQTRSTSGEFRYAGSPVRWGELAWRRRVAYIRETQAFYDELSVEQTLAFASGIYGEPLSKFVALAERFGLPSARRVGELSKGTTVKLGLAVSLAHSAELLLLDEPTAGLDPDARQELYAAVKGLTGLPSRPTILVSSHIFEDLDHLADEILILRDGRVVMRVSVEDLPRLALAPILDANIPSDAETVATNPRAGKILLLLREAVRPEPPMEAVDLATLYDFTKRL